MEFTATYRFARVSPQKARLVLDMIKGRRVEDALNALDYSTKRIAPDVAKVLRSAIANANYQSQEKGVDVDVDNLYVKNAIANEGPRMKRIRPAPMGRAFRYQRRLAHLSIILAEKGANGSSNGGGTAVTGEATETARPKQAKGRTAQKKSSKKTAAKKTAAKR
ncbi:MAG TPA: 50S ribosomal protein L22 [Terriglobales bacterium]|nr:50S ribosomal protein L22 [Terriglobales bacterium]